MPKIDLGLVSGQDGTAKLGALTVLIAAAKAEIREKYPDR